MLEQYLADLRQSCESRRIPLISKETQTFIISSMLDLSDLRKSCEDRHIPLISVQTQDFLVNRLERNQPKRVLEI